MPATAPVKFTGAVDAPWHNTWLAGWFTVGFGFTVMVKVMAGPVQLTPALVYVGITTIEATAGVVPGLMAIKLGILPVPLGPRPIPAPVLVQLNTRVPPVLELVKVIAVVGAPLHTTWLDTAFTVGVGFTVMVKVLDVPIQVTPPLV